MEELSAEDRERIEKIHAEWIERELAGNSLAVLRLCSDDVKWVLPDGSVLTGKDSISHWLGQSATKIRELRITDRAISGLGWIAYLTSRYSTTYILPGESEELRDHGRHLWFLQKTREGEWKVVLITWRSFETF